MRMKLHFILITALYDEVEAVEFHYAEFKIINQFSRNQDKIVSILKTNNILTAKLKHLISVIFTILLVIFSLNLQTQASLHCTSYNTNAHVFVHISVQITALALTFSWCSPMCVRYTLKWASSNRIIYCTPGMPQNQWHSKTCGCLYRIVSDAFFSLKIRRISCQYIDIDILAVCTQCLYENFIGGSCRLALSLSYLLAIIIM